MALRKKPELKHRDKTIDDRWSDMVNEAIARDMAEWLKKTINTQRPINSLKLVEMSILASIAKCTFIYLLSERAKWYAENDTNPPPLPPGFV